MRKAWLRIGLTSLLGLLPGAARAALTLTAVDLDVAIGGTNGTDTSFAVTITLTGTELGSATLTPLPGTSGTNLPCTGGTTCTATRNLTETEFGQLFPNVGRDFRIDVTQASPGTGTLTDTVRLPALPSVPSPAISAPAASTPVDPSLPLEVRFSACPACSATTRALLERSGTELATADLAASATSWTPSVALEPNATGYTVRITHRTEAALTPQPRYEPGDVAYAFTVGVAHSDAVSFSTSFAAPAGTFCIVVNDDSGGSLAAGCSAGADPVLVDGPALGILDTSVYGGPPLTLVAAGIDVEYTPQLAPDGSLTGLATADLDDDGSVETPALLAGRLMGRNGALRQKLRMRFDEETDGGFLLVRLLETADLATLLPPATSLGWLVEQRSRGRLGGAQLSETVTTTRTQAAETGWRLEFTLAGAGAVNGHLALASGVEVALRGSQRFDTLSNLSNLKLASRGAEDGVRVQIRKLVIDATSPSAPVLESGVLRYRAFGQRGTVLLP